MFLIFHSLKCFLFFILLNFSLVSVTFLYPFLKYYVPMIIFNAVSCVPTFLILSIVFSTFSPYYTTLLSQPSLWTQCYFCHCSTYNLDLNDSQIPASSISVHAKALDPFDKQVPLRRYN